MTRLTHWLLPVAISIAAPIAFAQSAVDFATAYRNAGEPRLMIFWGRHLDDALDSARVQREVTEVSASRGRARVETTKDEYTRESPSTFLRERDAAQLEASFKRSLQAAGAKLIDRNASMRSIQATGDRHERNAQLTEADAILDKADLLVEIAFVHDIDAYLGYGFKVAVKSLRSGRELTTFYTTASPPQRRVAGRYVAGDEGFQWVEGVAPAPTVAEVGIELAQSVQQQLAAVLDQFPERK